MLIFNLWSFYCHPLYNNQIQVEQHDSGRQMASHIYDFSAHYINFFKEGRMNGISHF